MAQGADASRDGLRGSFKNKMAGTTPCEATAQYTGHLCHVLSKGRDNPYTNFATLKQWACNTDEKAMRAHICKQFCWKPNAPEVKSWVATDVRPAHSPDGRALIDKTVRVRARGYLRGSKHRLEGEMCVCVSNVTTTHGLDVLLPALIG